MGEQWAGQLYDSCVQAAGRAGSIPEAIEATLQHLAEMRMLLPPGGVAEEQWRVVYTDPQDGHLAEWTQVAIRDRDDAEHRLRQCARYWHTARLQRRRRVLWAEPDSPVSLLYGNWKAVP